MASQTSRLRKTFRYPTDTSDDDSLPEAMDEEEQESLIKNLHEQNASLNIIYTRILLTLPLISILPYLAHLFAPKTTLLSLLSISSLLSTAYQVYTLPSGETGIHTLDKLNSADKSKKVYAEGPIRQYLPYLNIGLCLVLGVLARMVSVGEGAWWVLGLLPGGVYGIVLCGKFVMGGVDPGELDGLRYGFKGA